MALTSPQLRWWYDPERQLFNRVNLTGYLFIMRSIQFNFIDHFKQWLSRVCGFLKVYIAQQTHTPCSTSSSILVLSKKLYKPPTNNLWECICEDAAAKSQPQQILSLEENVLFQIVFQVSSPCWELKKYIDFFFFPTSCPRRDRNLHSQFHSC